VTLTPTLGTIEALYRKLEREAYRAWHSKDRLHKADHFFNFCVTAHSMRDYFFERKGIVTKSARDPYHQLWNQELALVAAADVANTTKHFALRFPNGKPRIAATRGVRTGTTQVVDIFTSSQGLHERVRTAPDVLVVLSDGARLNMWEFMDRVEKYWRQYLAGEGIRIKRQPFRHMAGSS
jgi:hypothetical protein